MVLEPQHMAVKHEVGILGILGRLGTLFHMVGSSRCHTHHRLWVEFVWLILSESEQH